MGSHVGFTLILRKLKVTLTGRLAKLGIHIISLHGSGQGEGGPHTPKAQKNTAEEGQLD